MKDGGQPSSVYLFWALIVMLVLYPIAVYNLYTQILFRFLLTAIILTGVAAISHERRHLIAGLCLAGPSLVCNVLVFFHRSTTLLTISIVMGTLFFLYLIRALLKHILRDHEVNADTIYCAASVYMLLSIVFAAMFILTEFLLPGSFKGDLKPNGLFPLTFADGLYFSVCTLTTVGYGDILPAGSEARCLAMLESMLGVLYPSVLIARLVGLHASNRGPGT